MRGQMRWQSILVALLLLPAPGVVPGTLLAPSAFCMKFTVIMPIPSRAYQRYRGSFHEAGLISRAGPRNDLLALGCSGRVQRRHLGATRLPLEERNLDGDAPSLPHRQRAERVAKTEANLNAIRTARGRLERKSGKYTCELCSAAFGKLKNYDQHLQGKQHRTNAAAVEDIWERFMACSGLWLSAEAESAAGMEGSDEHGGRTYSAENQTLAQMDVVKAWNPGELEDFPMRASGEGCMSPATRFQDLSLYMKARLLKYVSELMPYYPELPNIVARMAVSSPQHLRVKELFESFEAFKLLENFVVAAKKHRQIDHILDVACGHGLVGMLLAYRFPATTVTGVDVAVRPALAAWKHAFASHGQKMEFWSAPLDNFDFVNCGVEDLRKRGEVEGARGLEAAGGEGEGARVVVAANSLIVAVHGCNEVNRIAIETAIGAEALWATLPCCVPEQLYLPGASIKLSDDLNDNVRHTFMCGVMAERYKAQYIAQIDRRITNRAVMIAGGVSELDDHLPGGPLASKLVGFSRRVVKVTGAFEGRESGCPAAGRAKKTETDPGTLSAGP